MKTAKGKTCAPTSTLVAGDERERPLRWEQRIEGTPFARVLKTGRDGGAADATPPAASRRGALAPREVTIELRQTLNGFFSRFGGHMVRRAAPDDDRRGARRPGADRG